MADNQFAIWKLGKETVRRNRQNRLDIYLVRPIKE
jgi:hypothetical protein